MRETQHLNLEGKLREVSAALKKRKREEKVNIVSDSNNRTGGEQDSRRRKADGHDSTLASGNVLSS